MPRSQVIYSPDRAAWVAAEPEEVEALEAMRLIEFNKEWAGDARVRQPFSLEDIKSSLREMRLPDVV